MQGQTRQTHHDRRIQRKERAPTHLFDLTDAYIYGTGIVECNKLIVKGFSTPGQDLQKPSMLERANTVRWSAEALAKATVTVDPTRHSAMARTF
jgi:hypothetical protein